MPGGWRNPIPWLLSKVTSMYYEHLRGRGYQESGAGPVVFKGNVSVALSSDLFSYELEERSSIERHQVVGLYVTQPGVQVGQNKTQAATAIFDSIALFIRVNESDIIRKVYAHQILAANNEGKPFFVYLPGKINLSESRIEVYNNSAIPDNTVFEFQVDYIKTAKQ